MDKILYKFDDKNHTHLIFKDGEWKPLTGTSSVGGVLAKPLTWWAAGLAVEKFGWLNPRTNTVDSVHTALKKGYEKVTNLSLEAYANLLDEAYYAHSVNLKETAQAGTDLHLELEQFVKAEMAGNKKRFSKRIEPYVFWSNKNIKRYLASEAHCFDEQQWVGGIVDAVAEMNDGKLAVIDFKSSKEAYTNQFIQCGGYSLQLNANGIWESNDIENKKLGKPIEVLIIVPFGGQKLEPSMRYDVSVYEQAFKYCVSLYRLTEMDKL
jgi:hypothetical protein